MYKFIEKEGLTKIELIGKYKVLSRLFKISLDSHEAKNSGYDQERRNTIVDMFYMRYPNFKGIELKETYGIPVDNGVTQEIRSYNYPELELPNFPYYEELLYINTLCNKIICRELFPTMVGQLYFRIGYKNSFYKVIYVEYKYGHEQIIILQNTNNKSEIITTKVDEWSCGKLSGWDWSCNYESMLRSNLNKLEKEFESSKKNYEELLGTIDTASENNHKVTINTEPGTWLKFKDDDDDYSFGRLDKKPTLEDFPNVKNVLRITVDGNVYDASSWEILY